MENKEIEIAIEDHFIVVKLNHEKLLPEGEILENLIQTLFYASDKNQIVFDIPEPDEVFNDTKNFLENLNGFIKEAGDYNKIKKFSIITPHYGKSDLEKKLAKYNIEIRGVNKRKLNINYNHLSLLPFYDSYEDCSADEIYDLQTVIDTLEIHEFIDEEIIYMNNESDPIHKELIQSMLHNPKLMISEFNKSNGTSDILKRRFLQKFINDHLNKSLLAELFIDVNRQNAYALPYLSGSFDEFQNFNEASFIRPTISAPIIYQSQRTKLLEFTELLKKEKIKENEIQKFLEQNPFIFESLNYKAIRAQVVLERDDGTSLRPDFFLQPFGEDWWDILDLKLPNKSVIVGARDRKHFSAAVTEGLAQVREYSAYFENEIYQKRIEEKYGIKCYKPNVKLVIGKEFDNSDKNQVKRLMTSYEKSHILTFDQLVKTVKERLPI